MHTVISKRNVHRIPDIEREARAIFRPDSYIAEVAENRVELKTMDKDITPTTPDFRRAIDHLRNVIGEHRSTHPVARLVESLRLEYYELAARILEEKRQVIDCYAGWASAHLAPDGHVWGCCVRAESRRQRARPRLRLPHRLARRRGRCLPRQRQGARVPLPAGQRQLHEPAARRAVAGARHGAHGGSVGAVMAAGGTQAPDGLVWQDRAFPALLVVVSLAAYLALACPYVLGGDNAEFLSLAARGGVAHPPGYPLYTLLLRATSGWLAASPILGPARATAVIAALAAGALYVACRSFRATPGASLLAAALYASSPLAWLYATQAEVFALNALLAALLLWLSGPDCRVRGRWRLAGLALVTGLGLSHHHTILALGPIGVLGGLRALHEDMPAMRWRSVGLAMAAFVLGLTPYVYLVWVSHQPEGRWVWGPPMSPADLLRHFERVEYWEWKARDQRVPVPWRHMAALSESMKRGLLWIGVAVAPLGLAAQLMRKRGVSGFEPWSAVAFAASFLLAGPLMLAVLIGRPVGVYALVIERLHLLPLMLATVPVAWGVDVAFTRARPAVAQVVTGVATVAVLAYNGAAVPAAVRESERPTVEQYLRNTLGMLPPGAVVLGVGDHRCFGFFFLQTVEGVRPDVTYVEAGMLRDGWYRERIARALGGASVGDDAATLAATLADAGRAVFVTDSLDLLVPPGHPSYAIGTVVRLLPVGAEPPSPDRLEGMNLKVADAFVREPTSPRDPWGWSGEVDAMYARPWIALSMAFDASGQPEHAWLERQRALARAPASLR